MHVGTRARVGHECRTASAAAARIPVPFNARTERDFNQVYRLRCMLTSWPFTTTTVPMGCSLTGQPTPPVGQHLLRPTTQDGCCSSHRA